MLRFDPRPNALWFPLLFLCCTRRLILTVCLRTQVDELPRVAIVRSVRKRTPAAKSAQPNLKVRLSQVEKSPAL
jgi:hypothetical protein